MIKHVVSVSGGKDSTATLLIALENCPAENLMAIFCDTGNEHQHVYSHLDYLERQLDIKITRLKADFADDIKRKRMFIARDTRTKREYEKVPVLHDGKPVLVDGHVKMRKVRGKLVRWTNKAKRRALAALHPSGNPFLDLCCLKGRFPSQKAGFCTEELKRNIAVEFQLDLISKGHQVLSWQGIRRDESANRSNAKKIERVGAGLWIFRPIVDWTAAQVFEKIKRAGLEPNPLYLQGMGRVGCMPCINCRKSELNEIAFRFPDHIERIHEWEKIVSACSKRGFSTFFHSGPGASNIGKTDRRIFQDAGILKMVLWANTKRGGDVKQMGLFPDLPPSPACSSSYGLCEGAGN